MIWANSGVPADYLHNIRVRQELSRYVSVTLPARCLGIRFFPRERLGPVGPIRSGRSATSRINGRRKLSSRTRKPADNPARRTYQLDKAVAGPVLGDERCTQGRVQWNHHKSGHCRAEPDSCGINGAPSSSRHREALAAFKVRAILTEP